MRSCSARRPLECIKRPRSMQGAAVIEVPLERAHTWSLDPERLLAAWQPQVKLVYLCSPNNPTGNLLDTGAMETVCRALDGKAIVVIDEAYIEWSRRREPHRLARALFNARHSAHLVEGARPGRRARRCADRRPAAHRTGAARRAALLAGAARHRSGAARPRAAGSVRVAPPDRRLARRARVSARAPDGIAPGREGVAERCELSAGRLPRCRPLHALVHGRRHDRARHARQSGAAALAAESRWARACRTMRCSRAWRRHERPAHRCFWTGTAP